MVELFLWVLVLGYLLGWVLESWSEKALAQDSESVLAQRGLALSKVLGSVLDSALLAAALLVLVVVLVQVLV
jgi:hypothetical protein